MTDKAPERIQTAGDRLLELAKVQPDRPAVTDRGITKTFGQFAEDFGRTLTAVSIMQPPQDGLVAVEWDGLYRHWLLLLALESLGIASTSYMRLEGESGFTPLLSRSVLALGPGDAPAGPQAFVKTDDAWWARAMRSDPMHPPGGVPSQRVLRVISGSGTTGTSKLMAATAGQLAFRRVETDRQMQFDSQSRYLIAMSLLMQADYRRATACLWRGGMITFEEAPDFAATLRRVQPTHSVLMPRQILGLSDGDPVPGLMLSLIGARTTPELRDRLATHLTDRLSESYGANEVGSIATVDAQGLLTPVPGLEVIVTDTAGNPVPVGGEGQLRVRGPGVISGYLGDPLATADRFRDGWFLPGDLAVRQKDGRIRLTGRSDEILNIMGQKLLAPAFEEQLRMDPKIEDAALCFLRMEDEDILCAYIVAQTNSDWPALEKAIRGRFVPSLPKIALVRTDEIPRTANGKPRRGHMSEEATRVLASLKKSHS